MRRLFPAFILLPLILLTHCGGKEPEDDTVTVRTVSTATGELTLVFLGGCLVAERLVSYELWTEVKNWAENPARGGKVYSFTNEGRRYGAYTIEGMPGEEQFEPVVDINWRDAAVWMNAFTEWYIEHAADYSETAGPLEPVYYSDAACTVLLRHADSRKGVFVMPGATGFRLLEAAVWEAAYRREISGYDEEGNPERLWLFPDIDGPNSQWCFDEETEGPVPARSWRGGGGRFRDVSCSCAVVPPARTMQPDRTSSLLGVRFCRTADSSARGR